MLFSRRISWLLYLSLSFAWSCGSRESVDEAGVPETETAEAPSPSAPIPTACELLSHTEIETALGEPVTLSEADSTREELSKFVLYAETSCVWHAVSVTSMRTASIYARDWGSIEQAEERFPIDAQMFGPSSVQVDGLGDEAAAHPNGNGLFVRQSDVTLVINTTAIRDTAEALATTKGLAQKALARLE